MKKNILTTMMILILSLMLSACNSNSDSLTEAQNVLGDTVSTDIIEFTVKKAALAYSAEGATFEPYSYVIENADSVCEPVESGGFYQSNKGHALVCLDFVIKNLDRGYLNTDDSLFDFAISQGANEASVFGYDPSSPNGTSWFSLTGKPVAENESGFVYCRTGNIILDAGEYAEIKWVGVVNFEPDNLSEPFKLIVNVKNSAREKEKFIFTVE